MLTTIKTTSHAKILRTFEEVLALEEDWNKLAASMDYINPFLTMPWQETWLRLYLNEDQLFVITVYDENGQLCGVAPFKIARRRSRLISRFVRRVQFIGSYPHLYDGSMLIVSEDRHAEVIPAILKTLMDHQSEWDLLDLVYIPEGDQLQQLQQILPVTFPYCTVKEQIRNPYTDMLQYESWDDFLKREHSSGFKRDLRRRRNNLVNDHGAVFRSDVPPEAFESFKKLQKERLGPISQFNRFPHYQEFMEDLCRRFVSKGWAEFAGIYLPDRDEWVALCLNLVWRNQLTFCAFTFDHTYSRYGPGMLLFADVLSRWWDKGITRFDFGMGPESYKYAWAKDEFSLYQIQATRSEMINHLVNSDEFLFSRILSPMVAKVRSYQQGGFSGGKGPMQESVLG